MQKPSDCRGCPLEGKGISFSQPDGKGTREIVIIGEALGEEEAKDGLPFRPKASGGSKLEEVFRIAESELLEPVRREQFLLWNMVACQPPYNLLAGMYYESKAVEHCKRHFNRVVRLVGNDEDRVILALGNIPLRYLTNASGVAEEKQSISHLRGYVFKSKYGYVIPSQHPNFIKRGHPELTPLLVEDLKKAIKCARGEVIHRWHKDYVKPEYIEQGNVDALASFYYRLAENSKQVLTYDIETENSAESEEDERDGLDDTAEITQIQFSVGKGTGIAVPFNSVQHRPWIDKIMATPNVKANHNTWNFDNPRLRSKGVKIGGRVHDTMWMFKHYHPQLPRGLQSVASLIGFPFPWKHLFGSKLGWYGCADVDAVQWILAILPKLMKSLGIWEGYYDHVYRLYSPTLERAARIGIPVNERKRLEVLDYMTRKLEEQDKQLQELIPSEIKNITPKRKDKKTGSIDFGYILEPKNVKQLRRKYESLTARMAERDRGTASNTQQTGTGVSIKSFEHVVREKLGLSIREFTAIDNVTGSIKTVFRWCKEQPFKPSLDQVSRYIKWKKAKLEVSTDKVERELAEYYIVPKVPKVDKSTGERSEKESTGKKVLEDLYNDTGDEVLELILKIRSTAVVINNFIPNWKPGKDGAVHTQWGYTAASGQLDSRQPNILNCSKHTENGQIFRGIVEAP